MPKKSLHPDCQGAEDRLISKKQAMHVLTVSLSTLNRILREGKLPVCRIGQRRVGIPSSALQRFIHQGQTNAEASVSNNVRR